MDRCSYRLCSADLPGDSTTRRRYCRDTHRVAEYKAKRADALKLFLEGSALRAAGSTDTARMEAIDCEVARILGH